MFDRELIDDAIAVLKTMAKDDNDVGMERELRCLIQHHWESLSLHVVLHGNSGQAACGDSLEFPNECPHPVAVFPTHTQARMSVNELDLSAGTNIREAVLIDHLGEMKA